MRVIHHPARGKKVSDGAERHSPGFTGTGVGCLKFCKANADEASIREGFKGK